MLMHTESTNTRNLYVGDFNIWMDDQENRETQRFTEILDNYSIRNYVDICTHNSGHILDLVLTDETLNFGGPVKVEPVSTISDHRIIWFKIKLGSKRKATKNVKVRVLSSQNYEAFKKNIADVNKNLSTESCHHVDAGLKCLDCSVEIYKCNIGNFFNLAAPMI